MGRSHGAAKMFLARCGRWSRISYFRACGAATASVSFSTIRASNVSFSSNHTCSSGSCSSSRRASANIGSCESLPPSRYDSRILLASFLSTLASPLFRNLDDLSRLSDARTLQPLPEHSFSPGQPRHHRADRHFKDLGDFFVRKLSEIEEADGQAEAILQPLQDCNEALRVHGSCVIHTY